MGGSVLGERREGGGGGGAERNVWREGGGKGREEYMYVCMYAYFEGNDPKHVFDAEARATGLVKHDSDSAIDAVTARGYQSVVCGVFLIDD